MAATGLALLGMPALACEESPSTLDPQGAYAERIADLSWFIYGLGSAVFVVVVALFIVAFLRKNGDTPETAEAGSGHRFIVVGGIIVPSIILVGLMALTVQVGSSITGTDEPDALSIDVIGWQFWWEVRYPEQGIVTANEIHIPAGEKVRIRLISEDVIHSFWVPQLAGKVDMIPGQTNTIWIEADQPGIFRGQCAEFCGIQHAKMAFHIVADTPQEFALWVQALQQPPGAVVGDSALLGRALFQSLGCAACHGVQGTRVPGTAGPDLTHLFTRNWIAAGTLRNTRENLIAFITRAQEIKEGSSMPSYDELDEASLSALLDYLESLQ